MTTPTAQSGGPRGLAAEHPELGGDVPDHRTAAVFFDVDNLLTAGPASTWLATHLGHAAALRAAQRRHVAGQTTARQVADIDAAGWFGHTVRDIDALLQQLPVHEDVAPAVQWCHDHRIEPVLSTRAWQPVGAALARRFGFTQIGGPRIASVHGVYEGVVAEYLCDEDVELNESTYLKERGFPVARCGSLRAGQVKTDLLDASSRTVVVHRASMSRVDTETAVATTLLDALSVIGEFRE